MRLRNVNFFHAYRIFEIEHPQTGTQPPHNVVPPSEGRNSLASEPPTYPVVEDLHLAQDISEEKEVSENDLIFQNEDATDEFAFMPETPSRDPPIFGHHDMFADGKELQPATDTVHSDDAHHKAMSEFQIALALWVEQSQISRSEYESLLEVLSLLSSSEIDTLPKKLDTLKLHLRKCLPLLPLHRRLVAVDPKSQQTMPDLEKRLGIGQDKPQETTQFWFDMPELIKAIIQAHSKECHMGMAEYVDTPSELWHSRAWGSSILAASGHYAYSAANRAILPGDFIRFDPRPLAGLDVEANRGRVIFVGRDRRSKSPSMNSILLTVQPIVSLRILRHIYEGEVDERFGQWFLVEDKPLEIQPSDVLAHAKFEIDWPAQRSDRQSSSRTMIKGVFNVRRRKIRSVNKLHPVRGELETARYGRKHLLSFATGAEETISLPFMLFIDDFGVHRNMYKALKGIYLSPACLPYSERRRVHHQYTVTLGPHGARTADVVDSIADSFQQLERGVSMDVHGRRIRVCAFVMGLTGDMPQQAANSGFRSHKARVGCRTCYCEDHQREDMTYNVVENGRYHHETIAIRERSLGLPQSRMLAYMKDHGLQEAEPAIVKLAPTLDLILGRTYDIPHSEWKGIGRLAHEVLFQAALSAKGISEYSNSFQWFPTPSSWSRIQNPSKYFGSWSLSEHGRALILTPLILRRYADTSWFKADFLRRVNDVMRNQDHIPQELGSTDKITYAFGAIASAVSIVSVTTGANPDEIERLVIHGRKCFQSLQRCAAKLAEDDTTPPVVLGKRKRRITKKENPFLANCGLPNVHIGLHLGEFAREYGTLMNCNVLAGEAKHKVFKTWADNASPKNLMSYLFMKERMSQSLRLLVAGGFDGLDKYVKEALERLHKACPKLFRSLSPQIEQQQDTLENQTGQIISLTTQGKIHLWNSSRLRETGLNIPRHSSVRSDFGLRQQLRQAYAEDYSIENLVILEDKIHCFTSIAFDDESTRSKHRRTLHSGDFIAYGGHYMRVIQFMLHVFNGTKTVIRCSASRCTSRLVIESLGACPVLPYRRNTLLILETVCTCTVHGVSRTIRYCEVILFAYERHRLMQRFTALLDC